MDLSFYTNFATNIAQQEAQLTTLQQQVSTGLAVQTPDQNPAAYETATLGNDAVATLASDNTTQGSIQVQLGSVNDAYTSASNLFNNVQSILEQALNGSTSAENLQSLASQVESSFNQLQALGNTTSANGTYLFGGSRGSVAPFQTSSTGTIIYLGDGGLSQATISPDINASTIANGDVFVSSLVGDGIGNITAASTNAGTGQLIPQGVVNATSANAFQSGSSSITLSFAAGTGNTTTYTAVEGGTTIATGTLPSATTSTTTASVQLAGVDYTITGTPAAGDSFTIAPSRPQSAFTLLQNIYTALSTAGGTPAQVAQTHQVLNQALASIGQYQQAVVTAQAQNGVTLQAINNASTNNSNQSTELQTNVENTIGVNTPVAIASLDQTLTALQAAMKTFGQVQNLSLFNYL
jgi:flagellar hook-associated protein 3 FlgL